MVNSEQLKFIKKRLFSTLLWQRRLRRKYFVHPINRVRKCDGEYFTLVRQLQKYPGRYFKYFRMAKETYEKIFKLIQNDLTPNIRNFRQDVIKSNEKFVITLRFLATGSSYTDLAFRFRMGVSTVKKVVDQTIEVIIKNCLEIAIPSSRSTDDWKNIAHEFLIKWNFPNCVGALDGKHVQTFAPKESGSLYFNYKKTFSSNLMAVVYASYKLIMVDIGAYGGLADSVIFSSSKFGNAWINNPAQLNLPDDVSLPGTTVNMPYVIIADEGFSLKPTIMRPFPGRKLSRRERLFNYRLSRARRVVENAFGILAQTWRVLLNRFETQIENTNNITLAACILHNFLRMDNFDSKNQIPSDVSINCSMQTSGSVGYDIRAKFADWCIAEGDVDFQHKMID